MVDSYSSMPFCSAFDSGELVQGVVTDGLGNITCVSLAYGCKCHVVIPDDDATQKWEKVINLMLKTQRKPMVTYYKMIVDQNPISVFSNDCKGGFFADQFENLANFRAHYEGTGPEIWEQTSGELDAFEKNLKSFLVDPPGSGLFNKVTRGVMYTHEEAEG
ncbi:hypothetical protein C5167_042585 [Papaver somniferum]|uniref:Uncharacterized protein n=1 Tax=Papaver somniferum TaxID=3469 RepID=A0A4Y7L5Y3_PAPSO|nr:hypothetical protein C5167_042585 [Papaver somniferum]